MFLTLRTFSNLRQPAIRPEWRFLPIPNLHSTPPLGRFPSEYRHPVWYGKTRMVCLPDGEKNSKIRLFVLTWSTNVTDGQTDGHRMTAIAALMHSIARQKSQLSTNIACRQHFDGGIIYCTARHRLLISGGGRRSATHPWILFMTASVYG